MIDIEHPDIRRAERTGYVGEDIDLICPICHEACEILFEDINGIVFGCDECVTRKFIV